MVVGIVERRSERDITGLAAARQRTLEQRLARGPADRRLPCPQITLEGDANGAPHPDATTYAGKFSGPKATPVIAHVLMGGKQLQELGDATKTPLHFVCWQKNQVIVAEELQHLVQAPQRHASVVFEFVDHPEYAADLYALACPYLP